MYPIAPKRSTQLPLNNNAPCDIEVTVDIALCLFGADTAVKGGRPDGCRAIRQRCPQRVPISVTERATSAQAVV